MLAVTRNLFKVQVETPRGVQTEHVAATTVEEAKEFAGALGGILTFVGRGTVLVLTPDFSIDQEEE